MPSKSNPLLRSDALERTPVMGKSDCQDVKIKEEVLDDEDERAAGEEEEDEETGNEEDVTYPVDLPLEVITTIEPFNYAYPYLKNMSNGVLTHRNIFTEQEREVLRKIVDKYRDIVDTRSRTREIYMEKQTVWQQIVEEYNGTDNIMARTEKELKKCWDNMKYRAKQAEKEQQRGESSGGTSTRDSPADPHQIACSAVQAALEKMMSIPGSNSDQMCNGLGGGAGSGFSEETKENWNATGDGLEVPETKFAPPFEDSSKNGDDLCNNDEDDDQPVLKKARQESPKLSSILLGDTKKSSVYLKGGDPSSRVHYSIPNCTKITHIKKTKKKSGASNPVSILPKGLSSCVSIMNIPNPNLPPTPNPLECSTNLDLVSNGADLHQSGAINLGGGITISPQKTGTVDRHPPPTETSFVQMKPLPCLRKMIPTGNVQAKKKAPRTPLHLLAPYSRDPTTPVSDSGLDGDAHTSLLEEKLLQQRLEFCSQEHALRMKVLEKQLQAYTNEAQFWALKTKLLRNGNNHVLETLMNGDV